MTSMSYCVFENTAGDMSSCVEKIEDWERLVEMNEYEQNALPGLVEKCRNFINAYERVDWNWIEARRKEED